MRNRTREAALLLAVEWMTASKAQACHFPLGALLLVAEEASAATRETKASTGRARYRSKYLRSKYFLEEHARTGCEKTDSVAAAVSKRKKMHLPTRKMIASRIVLLLLPLLLLPPQKGPENRHLWYRPCHRKEDVFFAQREGALSV